MKIAVLMSGGIDSSFVAFYLKKQGFDVIGITFLHFNKELQKKDTKRVKKIAKELKIPHFLWDIREDFRKKVINPFLQDYKRGLTPNPCPFCNKKIKFDAVFKKVKILGIEKIATGHYVRLISSANSEIFTNKRVNLNQICYSLMRPKDKSKDQSYFLWQLTQKELKKLIFPLGDFKKEEIFRKIKNSRLKKYFKESNYRESQDICFLRKSGLEKFLEKGIGKKRGIVLNKNGKKLGVHNGSHFFTIGQRSGIKIGAQSPDQKPLYVIEKRAKDNTLIVGEEKDLYKKELFSEKLNWISGKEPQYPLLVDAQIRYRAKPAPATISKISFNKYKVKFKTPQRAITPGQHIVFYKKDTLLGGGIIKRF